MSKRNAPDLDGSSMLDNTIVAYVTDLLRAHRVADAAFAAMRERFGTQALVELTTTAGYYSLIACTLNAFGVPPDPGADILPD